MVNKGSLAKKPQRLHGSLRTKLAQSLYVLSNFDQDYRIKVLKTM